VPLAAQNLFEIEDEFHENMNEILERFYNRYQNVFKYISGFNRFLGDMTSGYFIQYTVDGLLLDTDGKQLVVEAFYLLGVMLLQLGQRILGLTRAKMIIAYYRAKGESTITNVDEACKLCRSTDYIPARCNRANTAPLTCRTTTPSATSRVFDGRWRASKCTAPRAGAGVAVAAVAPTLVCLSSDIAAAAPSPSPTSLPPPAPATAATAAGTSSGVGAGASADPGTDADSLHEQEGRRTPRDEVRSCWCDGGASCSCFTGLAFCHHVARATLLLLVCFININGLQERLHI
jgi:hypothetical protein